MFKIKEFIEKLQNDGVMFKGFGIVPKFVMQDADLSLEAKAICALLASYAGNKDSAYPGLRTILSNLNISKNGYYPHLNQLIKHGYITVTKGKGVFSNNIYTLIPFPEKFAKYARENGKEYTHIKEYGYGMIPKAVMLDGRLDIKAKGLYAYYASIGGADKIAIRGQETILRHLNICPKTYYTYYNQLLDLNYITSGQGRMDPNRYAPNFYYLNPKPDVAKARQPLSPELYGKLSALFSTRFSKAVGATEPTELEVIELGKNGETLNKDTLERDDQNGDANINSRNKNISNSNISISSRPTPSPKLSLYDLNREAIDDEFDNLKSVIGYSTNIYCYSQEKRDEIDKSIRFCAEFLAINRDSFNIGKNIFKKDDFRQTILNISFSSITNVLDRISSAGRKINNAKNYIVSSIYNQILNSSANEQNGYDPYGVRIEYQTFVLHEFFDKAVKAGMRYDKDDEPAGDMAL